MTLERARELAGQITNCAHKRIVGWTDGPGLPDVPLAEMLEANRMVREAASVKTPTGRLIAVTCDDRLVAALYVLENYEPSPQPIIIGEYRLVAVLPRTRK